MDLIAIRRVEKNYGKKKAPQMDLSPFSMFKMFGDMLGEGKKKSGEEEF